MLLAPALGLGKPQFPVLRHRYWNVYLKLSIIT